VSGGDRTGSAAGWYPDPRGECAQRYWDGLAWTSFARDAQTASAAPDAGLDQPAPPVTAPEAGEATIDVRAVANAQKLVLYAIALSIVVLPVRVALASSSRPAIGVGSAAVGLVGLIAFAGAVMVLVGAYWLASALGYRMRVRVLCVVLMFLPLINLVALFILNTRATAVLRAFGLKVGFLGVRRR
jgi:Protein of unknown function (DUF2510)